MSYDEDLANRLREALAAEEGIREKRMFGGLAFLINGNLALSASGRGGLMCRVGAGAAAEVLSRPHVEAVEMGGRQMTGWVRVAPEGVRTSSQLQAWVRRGLEFTRALPPKA